MYTYLSVNSRLTILLPNEVKADVFNVPTNGNVSAAEQFRFFWISNYIFMWRHEVAFSSTFYKNTTE